MVMQEVGVIGSVVLKQTGLPRASTGKAPGTRCSLRMTESAVLPVDGALLVTSAYNLDPSSTNSRLELAMLLLP